MPTRIRPPDLLARPGQDALTAEGPPWAGLRLVAVPAGWPPYDCEAHGTECPATALEAGYPPTRPTVAGQASPAWDRAPARDEAGLTAGTSAEAARPAAAAETAKATSAGEPQAPHPDQAPGPSAAWCGQFARVLVEVLAGCRPAKQLARVASERVREQIDLLSCAVAGGQRPRIRRVMMSRPAADVVEMTLVVSFGPRSRALAIRFEHTPARPPTPGRPARPARWICTEIETS